MSLIGFGILSDSVLLFLKVSLMMVLLLRGVCRVIVLECSVRWVVLILSMIFLFGMVIGWR